MERLQEVVAVVVSSPEIDLYIDDGDGMVVVEAGLRHVAYLGSSVAGLVVLVVGVEVLLEFRRISEEGQLLLQRTMVSEVSAG